jgi:SAM-dependent methyltransferase
MLRDTSSMYACPECKKLLELAVTAEEDGDVLEGEFRCDACSITFPIVRGVPRFAGDMSVVKEHTASSFGYKWSIYSEIDKSYQKNFLDELAPLDLDTFFKDKLVLDAGTGMGIPSFSMAELGARQVYGVDISSEIEIARRNTSSFSNISIAQADIYKIPFERNAFDVVVCVAVLQHLPHFEAAITQLLSHLKPGGTLIIWVYGRENNGFVQYVVEPSRKLFFRKIPVKAAWALSVPLGGLFHAACNLVYKPLNDAGVTSLPMRDYFLYRTNFDLEMNTQMVFDQLLAPLSYLFTREEVDQLLSRPEIESYQLRHHNENSWTGIGIKA